MGSAMADSLRGQSGFDREQFAARTRPGSWMEIADRLAPLVYVSDVSAGAVAVFDRDGTVRGQIAGLSNPEGMFVDARHNLWVANAGGSDILEFARGAIVPRTTLVDRTGYPSDVTICPNGTIYVSNTLRARAGGGDILVFAPGSPRPSGTLRFPAEFQNYFLTCDTAGNVFSTVTLNPGGGAVLAYPGGKQRGASQLPIQLSNFPGGIKQDSAGNLLIADQLNFNIAEYTEAGSPTGFSIKSPDDYTVPVDIAVTDNGKDIGVALFDVRQGGNARGQTYAYPSGAPQRSYNDGFNKPIGFAFDPGH